MKTLFSRKFASAAALTMALSITGMAQVTWTAKCWNQGPTRDGSPIPLNRSIPQAAEVAQGVAAGIGDFYSLGSGGYIILEASDKFGPSLTISEVTFGNPPCGTYREKADVYVSQTGLGWVFLKTVCHDDAIANLGALSWAKYVKIVDKTINVADPTPGPNDGVDFFDVDGLVAEAYPENTIPLQCTATSQGKSWDGVTNVHPLRSFEAKGRVLEGLIVPHTINTNLRDNSKQMNFFSLGFGGEMCFGFDPVIVDLLGDDFQIFETTWRRNGSNVNGCTQDYPEKAEIYVSTDGNAWVFAGIQCKDYGSTSGKANGYFDINGLVPFVKYLRIKDITDKTKHKKGSDAFDVDGIRTIYDFSATTPENFSCENQAARKSVGSDLFDQPVMDGGVPEEMESMTVVGNPVSDKLTVRFVVGEEGGMEFIIRDFTGREVSTTPYIGSIYSTDELSIPTDKLPSGNYLVTLKSSTYKEVVRFVKK